MLPADVKLRFRFSKRERISSKITFQKLLQKNRTLFVFPFKIYFDEVLETEPILDSIAISVPKRSFKHAVARNRIKRMIREAYRLNHFFVKQETKKTTVRFYHILFVYIAKKELTYEEIEHSVCEILSKIFSLD